MKYRPNIQVQIDNAGGMEGFRKVMQARRQKGTTGLTREQLEPLVEAGLTQMEIAAQLDTNQASVSRYLNKYGLKK